MRYRSKQTSDHFQKGKRVTLTEYTSGGSLLQSESLFVDTTLSYPLISSVMTDQGDYPFFSIRETREERQIRKLKTLDLKRQRIAERDERNLRRSRGEAIPKRLLRPVHPVTHSTVKISYCGEVGKSYVRWDNLGGPSEKKVTRTETFPNGASFLKHELPGTFDDVMSVSGDVAYTAEGYKNHDWYHLIDLFHEACDQFIPSSFMLGEDMVESEIFIDALKTVINPTRLIGTALKTLKYLGRKKYKRIKLGDTPKVIKSLLGKGSQNQLAYSFGVSPAIHDIRDALGAHKKVSERIAKFHKAAGNFVPIRVRQPLASAVANPTFSELDAPVYSSSGLQFFWICDSKETIAAIGCNGRVRDDLHFNDTWSAYLQYFGINKVLGLAWELIPMSFVVDWFTNTSEFINKYTRLHTGNPYTEFQGLCTSKKTILTERLICVPGYSLSDQTIISGPSLGTTIATRTTTSYVRDLSLPEASNGFDFGQLGLFHAVTSFSLIVRKYFHW